MKERKNYNRWVHFYPKDIEHLSKHIMLCGKKYPSRDCAHEAPDTFCCSNELNKVTCPRCMELLKDDNWYCSNCGFIDGCHVTYEESCDICGRGLF